MKMPELAAFIASKIYLNNLEHFYNGLADLWTISLNLLLRK